MKTVDVIVLDRYYNAGIWDGFRTFSSSSEVSIPFDDIHFSPQRCNELFPFCLRLTRFKF